MKSVLDIAISKGRVDIAQLIKVYDIQIVTTVWSWKEQYFVVNVSTGFRVPLGVSR